LGEGEGWRDELRIFLNIRNGVSGNLVKYLLEIKSF